MVGTEGCGRNSSSGLIQTNSRWAFSVALGNGALILSCVVLHPT